MKVINRRSVPDNIGYLDSEIWSVASRQMRVALECGQFDRARAILNAFISEHCSVKHVSAESSIYDLGMCPKLSERLYEEGYKTVLSLASASDAELMRCPNIGPRSVNEVRQRLFKFGFRSRDDG